MAKANPDDTGTLDPSLDLDGSFNKRCSSGVFRSLDARLASSHASASAASLAKYGKPTTIEDLVQQQAQR